MNTMSLLCPLLPLPPLIQCAAVISRSSPGLETTLAVQKWLPVAPCSNSAPTRSPDRVPAVRESADCPGCGTRSPLGLNGRAPSSLLLSQYAAPLPTKRSSACGTAAQPATTSPAAARADEHHPATPTLNRTAPHPSYADSMTVVVGTNEL